MDKSDRETHVNNIGTVHEQKMYITTYIQHHVVTARETDDEQRRWTDELESITNKLQWHMKEGATESNETRIPNDMKLCRTKRRTAHKNTPNSTRQTQSGTLQNGHHKDTAKRGIPYQIIVYTRCTYGLETRTMQKGSIILRTKGQSSDRYTRMRYG